MPYLESHTVLKCLWYNSVLKFKGSSVGARQESNLVLITWKSTLLGRHVASSSFIHAFVSLLLLSRMGHSWRNYVGFSTFWCWKYYAFALITLPCYSGAPEMFCFQQCYCFHVFCPCVSVVQTIQNFPIIGLLLLMKFSNWRILVCHANKRAYYLCDQCLVPGMKPEPLFFSNSRAVDSETSCFFVWEEQNCPVLLRWLLISCINLKLKLIVQ